MLEMDEGARLWLYKKAHKEFWRVSKWYEFDDLVQDGFMKFYHVRATYPSVIEYPHLMALFKVAFTNHIHMLATKRTHAPELFFADMLTAPSPEADQETLAAERVLPPEQPFAPLFTAILNAPAPVRELLAKIAGEPTLPALSSACRLRRDGTKETLNERLCRLVRLDHTTINLVGMLKETLAV